MTWYNKKLVDIAEVRVSNVDKKLYATKQLIRLCNYMDAYSNDYITSKIDFTTGSADLNQLSRFGLKKNDVIITKDSETPEDIAVSSVVDEEMEKLVCGYHLAILRPFEDEVDGTFLMQKLKLPEVKNYFFRVANGSTRFGMTIGDIENAPITLPKIGVQKEIAIIIRRIDTVIEKTQQVIAKYKCIKQGILNDLFTRGIGADGKLRSTAQEAPELYKSSALGLIPKEWEVETLFDCCDFITDGSHFSPSPIVDGYLIVNVKDMGEYCINYDTCTRISEKDFLSLKGQNCSPQKGDVLVSKDGTVGRVLFFNEEREVVLLSSIAIIRPQQKLLSEFLYLFFKSNFFERQLKALMSGSALKRIVLRDINLLKAVFPKSTDEQRGIATMVSAIENKIQQEEKYLSKTISIKQGLMADLLTGKKEVKLNEEMIKEKHLIV